MRTSVRAVLSAVSVNLLAVLPIFLTGAMAVQIGRDLGVPPTQLAMLASLFAIATMLSSAPLGGMVGRIGVRRSMWVSAGIATVSLLLAAVSTNVWLLGTALAAAGLGNGLGQPAGNAVVAGHISEHRFGLAYAIKQSGIPLATMLGGLAVPAIALTVGWRWAYLIAATLAVLAAALVPADPTHAERRVEAAVPEPTRVSLWVLSVGVGALAFAATSIGALGAAGGVAVGLPESTAGLLVAAGGLAGMSVRLGAGVMADKFQFDALVAVATLAVVGALGWLVMSLGIPSGFAVGLVVANAFGWGWPGLQHLAIARRFPTATAAASGVNQTGVGFGLLLGPLLLGFLAGNSGWRITWIAAAAAAFTGAAVVLTMSGRLPRQPAR